MTQPPLQGLQYAGAFAALHVVLSLAFKGVYGEKRSHLTAMGGTGAVKDPAKVRDMVAFNLITAGFQFYCAWFGTVGWYDGTADAIGGSTKERLYSHSQIAETMCVVALGFEIYNTCMVLFFTEYRNAPFIGHHTVTGTLAYLCMHPFAHYFCFFYFGLASISSVPLALVEIAELNGRSAIAEALKSIFAVLFLAFRTAYWPFVCYVFWGDMLSVLSDGTCHSHATAYIFLGAQVFLTGLQWLWTGKIISGIQEMAKGKVAKKN